MCPKGRQMVEGASSVEAQSQGSIQASEGRMEEEHAHADGNLGDETQANADDAGADTMMNAAGEECADKGEDNDCAQSVGVPQGVGNGGCGLASDAREVTERLEETEHHVVNGSHYREGRNGHDERDLHPCGGDALPMARRGVWMLSKVAALTQQQVFGRQIDRFLDSATRSAQERASPPKTFLMTEVQDQLQMSAGSTNQFVVAAAACAGKVWEA